MRQGYWRKKISDIFCVLDLCTLYKQEKKDHLDFMEQTKKGATFLTRYPLFCINTTIKIHGPFGRLRADLFKYGQITLGFYCNNCKVLPLI